MYIPRSMQMGPARAGADRNGRRKTMERGPEPNHAPCDTPRSWSNNNQCFGMCKGEAKIIRFTALTQKNSYLTCWTDPGVRPGSPATNTCLSMGQCQRGLTGSPEIDWSVSDVTLRSRAEPRVGRCRSMSVPRDYPRWCPRVVSASARLPRWARESPSASARLPRWVPDSLFRIRVTAPMGT